MKKFNAILLLTLVVVIVRPVPCQSQIKITSAEQVAKSLAEQLYGPNTKVKSKFTEYINLVNQRTALIEELIPLINKFTNGESSETKEFAASLKAFKSINLSVAMINNKEQFNTTFQLTRKFEQSIGKFLNFIYKNNINDSSVLNIQAKMEGLENRIVMQRQYYNVEALSYNSEINKNANNKFFDEYPDLGLKCYFLFDTPKSAEKPPVVKFN